MRHPSTCVTLLLAACVAAPADSCIQDPVGHYRMQHGHEFWEEVDVLPDGLCTWWSCRCGPFGGRTAVSCHWRIDGNAIVFTTDDGTWRLHLRQHEGHVYLVPRAHLDWFDANGPYEELCFSSDGAPLLSYPPYMAADAVNSSWRHGVTTSGPGVDPRAVQVSVGDDELSVELADGRRLSVPLVWFPRLLHADAAQRRNWRLLGDGQGISWPDLHEDLSVEGLLRGCVGPGASWRAI